MNSGKQKGMLAPFARLVGGEWHTEGSYQVFEWGVGETAVKARSYALHQGSAVLVSEGVWFWHPGQQVIKGFFTAIEMPVVFFDYTTRFEGRAMISDLTSYSAEGKPDSYMEKWEFTGDDHYSWKLASKAGDAITEVMSASFTRKQ